MILKAENQTDILKCGTGYFSPKSTRAASSLDGIRQAQKNGRKKEEEE